MIWVLTARGRKMPLDAVEVSRAAAGSKALLFEIQDPEPGSSDRTPRGVVTHAQDGHLSHWATCDKREDFKR